MNTKEAKEGDGKTNENMYKEEFLRELHKEGILSYGDNYLEDFKRLQEFKKYKEMWGELATMYKLPCYGLENSKVLGIVKFLEQKYFPEPKSRYERINDILDQLTPPGAAIDIRKLKNLLIELRDEE